MEQRGKRGWEGEKPKRGDNRSRRKMETNEETHIGKESQKGNENKQDQPDFLERPGNAKEDQIAEDRIIPLVHMDKNEGGGGSQ